MHQPADIDLAFADLVLRGLADFDVVAGDGEDLCLELALSIWMRRCGTDLAAARATVVALPPMVAEAGGLEPRTEPAQLVGRSPKDDVVTISHNLGNVLARASWSAGCSTEAVIDRVLDRLARVAPAGSSRAAG
jgi:hypothetical protein